MHLIKNLTASPMDLPGGIVLPAFGEVSYPHDTSILSFSPALHITPVEDDPLEPFRVEYHRLTGKRADRRWSEERLFKELEAAE